MKLWHSVAVVLFAVLIAVPLFSPKHVFNPLVLKKIANDAVAAGGNSTVIVNRVMASMKEAYPQWTVPEPGELRKLLTCTTGAGWN